jgi:hypothetical protein
MRRLVKTQSPAPNYSERMLQVNSIAFACKKLLCRQNDLLIVFNDTGVFPGDTSYYTTTKYEIQPFYSGLNFF